MGPCLSSGARGYRDRKEIPMADWRLPEDDPSTGQVGRTAVGRGRTLRWVVLAVVIIGGGAAAWYFLRYKPSLESAGDAGTQVALDGGSAPALSSDEGDALLRSTGGGWSSSPL